MKKEKHTKYIPHRLSVQKKENPLTRLMDSPFPRDKKHLPHRILWLLLLGGSVLGLAQIGALWLTGSGAVEGLFAAYFREPQVIAVNFAPLLLLAGALYALSGQAAVAAGVPALLVTVLAIANQVKIGLRGEPLLITDLAFAGEVGNIAGNYTLRLTGVQAAMVAALVLSVIALVPLTWKMRLRGKWGIRIPAALVLLAGCAGVIFGFYADKDRYDRFYAGDEVVSVRSAVQWYAAHGPLYAFLHAGFEGTDGDRLSDSEFWEIVDKYLPATSVSEGEAGEGSPQETAEPEAVGIPEDRQVSVLMFQLEAYCDLSEYLDIPAVEEFYEPLHRLQEQSVSGELICNVFGGGTITTERAIISGYTSLTEFTVPTNSYAWYLMSQSYTVEGSHPGYAWYYDRDTVNANLGFERYLYSENYYEPLVPAAAAPWNSDPVLFDTAVDLMEEQEGPYFSLNICYQNHGPYEVNFLCGEEYLTAADCPETGTRNILNNYLHQLSSTHQEILNTVARLEEMERPVILVLYGDHKPYLGSYGTCTDGYEAMGINMDTGTDEGFCNTYSTPYLIWANSAAKEVLGSEFTGDGPTISPCFLMNTLFDLCGWGGDPLMAAANDLMEELDMVHTAVTAYGKDGLLLESLTEEQEAALEEFLTFQEYWQTNFMYEELAARIGEQPDYEAPDSEGG